MPYNITHMRKNAQPQDPRVKTTARCSVTIYNIQVRKGYKTSKGYSTQLNEEKKLPVNIRPEISAC
jgi:hypothetical protein